MRLQPWFQRPAPAPQVEPLEQRHAARLAAIHESSFARPWSVLDFERLIADRTILSDGLFFARSPDPVGFILSRFVAEEAEVLTVALAPESRGKGCARRLLVPHLDALSARRVRSLHLEVEEGNLPALALYRRLGFREIGRRPGYYARPDGSRATALAMTLDL